MLYAFRTSDKFSAQYLAVAFLSVVVSLSILRTGLKGADVKGRDTRSLIRSGFILIVIWSYRLYFILRTVKNPLILRALTYTSLVYIILSSLIVATGFKIKGAFTGPGQEM